MRFENKTAVITGASHGLGKEIALKLIAEGTKAIVADISVETASVAAEGINTSSDTAKALAVNIAKQDEVKTITDFTMESFGTLDVIVDNAEINRNAILHEMTVGQWDQVITVNLIGTFCCIQYVAQIMREKGSDTIINASPASWLGGIGQANYAASKAGVVGLIKTVCRKLARKGVTCNAICPDSIDMDIARGVPERAWGTMISKIPTGRAGNPTDVTNMAAFLASGEASYITGEVINVGDGMIP